jgi:hypothetical protein
VRLKKPYIPEETFGLEDQILHKMELIDQLIPPSARYDPECTGTLPIILYFALVGRTKKRFFSFLSRHIFRISTWEANCSDKAKV